MWGTFALVRPRIAITASAAEKPVTIDKSPRILIGGGGRRMRRLRPGSAPDALFTWRNFFPGTGGVAPPRSHPLRFPRRPNEKSRPVAYLSVTMCYAMKHARISALPFFGKTLMGPPAQPRNISPRLREMPERDLNWRRVVLPARLEETEFSYFAKYAAFFHLARIHDKVTLKHRRTAWVGH